MSRSVRDMVGVGSDISSILGVLVPALALLVSGGGLAIWTSFPQYWVTIVGVLSIALFLLGGSLIASVLLARYRLLERDINADWIVLNDQRKAMVHSRTRIDYHYHIEVRARRESDTLKMRADWSGAGSLEVFSNDPACKAVLETTSGNQDFFRIIAPFPVPKGKTFTFDFRIETDGSRWEQKPVFGIRMTHGRRKSGKHELSVIFDPGVSIVEDEIVRQNFAPDVSFPEIVALPLDAATRTVKLPFSIKPRWVHAIIWEYR